MLVTVWDGLFPLLSILLFAACALLVRGCDRV